jgi:phosphoribosyl-dephospho-CoA transferase
MNRHDLVYVSPAAWQTLIRARTDLADEPIVKSWVDYGWPLVGRRLHAGEGDGVPLGLPLPPSAGKKRISVLVRPNDVVKVVPSPTLASVVSAAPRPWGCSLLRLSQLASRHSLETRVFGSLAWQVLTGLPYVSDASDLDFTLHVRRDTPLRQLACELACIEADAPMRLDGEFILGGSAVNWRELHGGAREVLVKTATGISLFDVNQFISGRMPA